MKYLRIINKMVSPEVELLPGETYQIIEETSDAYLILRRNGIDYGVGKELEGTNFVIFWGGGEA